jgi:hypothetical protein
LIKRKIEKIQSTPKNIILDKRKVIFIVPLELSLYI